MDERDDLIRLLYAAGDAPDLCHEMADAVLAAGYVPPAEVARRERDAAVAALREAADAMRPQATRDRSSANWRAHAWGNWLRDRADRIEATP